MSTYSEKLKDPRWQKKRLEIFQRDQFTCQECSDTKSTLHAHHIYYEPASEPWEYFNEALITLCASCHEIEHEAMKIAIVFLRKQMAASGICTSTDVSYLESVIRENFKQGVFHGQN